MNLKESIQHKIFEKISAAADELGYPAYVTGGYVRDSILQRPTKDIDVVAVGSGIVLAKKVARLLGPDIKVSIYKNFGTAMLHWGELEIEFVGARKESYSRNSRKPVVEDGTLEDDQLRRDFTINAMAISLNSSTFGELADPFHGRKHLEQRLIKTPLEPGRTFSDDPLRAVRAVRFATQLDFQIEEETYQALIDNAERLNIISRERIVDELNKIIMAEHPSKGFSLLMNTGLLQQFLPEIVRMKGVEKKEKHTHKDNFKHTLEVLDNLAAENAGLWLRWAGLLHDIGKPICKKYTSRSGYTFHGHEVVGSQMVPEIFKRLKMPLNDKMRFVKKMVYLHLRPIELVEDKVTDSALRRLLFEAGDDIDDLMKLCKADITSKNQNRVKKYRGNFKHVKEKLKEVEEKDRLRNWQPPISGDLIMKTFGIPPSKNVGIIKSAIREAILDGEINGTYEQAYDFMLKKAKEIGLEPIKPKSENTQPDE
ncbi:MAG: HD domain-containing protein [Bacteroidales bacterium]